MFLIFVTIPLILTSIITTFHSVELQSPDCPLQEESVQVQTSYQKPFGLWNQDNFADSYHLIHDVAKIFRNKGEDWLGLGVIDTNTEPFHYELVPFNPKSNALFQQTQVMWKSFFGAPCFSKENLIIKTEQWKEALAHIDEIILLDENHHEQDPFCDPNVIEKQQVYQTKTVRLLYNFAPVATDPENLHFLIIPVSCKPFFLDLSSQEFIESEILAQKIVKYYFEKGYSKAYLLNKNGAAAGQTVFHWHQHLIFSKEKKDDWFSKAKLFKNMLFGSKKLSDPSLKGHVDHLKENLGVYLSK